jgi:hypothetical protein
MTDNLHTFQVGDPIRTSATIRSGRYRDRPGFVVVINHGGGPGNTPEYGVILTTTRPPWRKEPDRTHEVAYDSDQLAWFAPHELNHRAQ